MLIATFSLAASAIALEETLSQLSKITIEAERIAAHSTEWTLPCLWVAGAETESIENALATDPTVKSLVDITSFNSQDYVHIEWTTDVIQRINSYTDKEASILKATATNEGWNVQFRFVSRDQLNTFRESLGENGYAFELLNLYEPETPRATTGGVTPTQREALIAAREHGYFKVPREISGRELAADLGMSHQSLSELLRRGTEQLIDSTLTTRPIAP